MIVCSCKCITEEEFRESLDGSTLLELQKRLGFARGMCQNGKSACGSCMPNFVKLYSEKRG